MSPGTRGALMLLTMQLACGGSLVTGREECEATSLYPEGLWAPFEAPDTNCVCDASNSGCHALYEFRVDGVRGPDVFMSFRKIQQASPFSTIRYAVMQTDQEYPECLWLDELEILQEGDWAEGERELSLTVNPWGSEETFARAASGDVARVMLATEGSDARGQWIWFQGISAGFEKTCRRVEDSDVR